jgi:uncharacterized protein (DUF58 family)
MENKNILLDPKILAKISNLSLVARTAVEGFISGMHKGLYKGSSVEFYEHREYVPGDELKYLDWKIYARTDRLYLKTFREETNLKSYILLDISNSMNFASGEISKLQYSIMLAASLSYLMINQSDAVGIVTFDKEIRDFIKASSASSHFHYLIDVLEKISPAGKTATGQVLEKIAPYFKKRSLIILISDLFDRQDKVIKGLSHFKHRKHEVLVFHIMDPAELNFPYNERCEFYDMETKEKITVDASYIKQDYHRLMNDFLTNYRKSFVERNIDYRTASTDIPFDQFLYDYLNIRNKNI